jgi:hypothetical protein
MARGGRYSTALRQITFDAAALRQITGQLPESRRHRVVRTRGTRRIESPSSTLLSPKTETGGTPRINLTQRPNVAG